MEIDYQLKPKRFLWRLIPGFNSTAQAIYPNIYLPKFVYENLISDSPKPEYLAVLEHEKVHIKSQKRLGLIKSFFMYLFNSSFRFEEELAAYKVQIKILKQNKQKFHLEKIAKNLSGSMYLWSTSYKNALERLQENIFIES